MELLDAAAPPLAVEDVRSLVLSQLVGREVCQLVEQGQGGPSNFGIVGDAFNEENSQALRPVCLLDDGFYVFASEEVFVTYNYLVCVGERREKASA